MENKWPHMVSMGESERQEDLDSIRRLQILEEVANATEDPVEKVAEQLERYGVKREKICSQG